MSDLEQTFEKTKAVPGIFSLTGKTALVVGGTKGLGQAMALGLAAAGADVCVASRGPDGLEDTADAIGRLGRKGSGYAADVTSEEQVQGLMEFMLKTYGKLDILVNSQGISYLQDSVDFDMDAWQRLMDVNLKSLVLTCKHAGRIMLKQGHGKIINISSVRSVQGRAQDLAYAPSKGAVNQLTRSLAIEWGSRGINVNAIAPSVTRSEMYEKTWNDEAKKNYALSRIPMGRIGELEDLFGPVIFFASEASNFVNGHTLFVDGGWTIA
jgi:NAD(P)-dependent dehydrogenase (short-subunit alcohol dehydrogenase family)